MEVIINRCCVTQLRHACLGGQPPIYYEDGWQLCKIIPVLEMAWANLFMLEDKHADYEVFNVVGVRKVTVVEYAHLVADRATIHTAPEVPGMYRFSDTRHVFSDVSKLKALGWQPEVPLEDIVDEYLSWVQEQREFQDYYTEAESQMQKLGTLRKVEL